MNKNAKIGFFFLALTIMTFLAVASVMMALNQAIWAVVFFVVAFVLVGIGFMTRKRLLAKEQ